MSKFSREDINEDDVMAINRSKKTSFKRIRQLPASGSEDEMANSPVPPKPPAIALANTNLSSQSNLQSQRSCIKRTKSLPSNSKKPTRNENVRCFPEKQTGLRDTTSKPNDSFKDDSDILSFSDRTHHFSTRYRPVNYGYSVPEFGDEGEFQSMDTDLNQSNSENPENTRINHARHGSEKHSLQPNMSSNSIDTIEDDGNISKNIQLPFSGQAVHFSTRHRPVNYGYSVPSLSDEEDSPDTRTSAMEPEKAKTKSFHESDANHSVTKAKLALSSTSMAGKSNSDKGKSLLPSSNNKQQKSAWSRSQSAVSHRFPNDKAAPESQPHYSLYDNDNASPRSEPYHSRYDNNKASAVSRSQNSLRTVKFRNNETSSQLLHRGIVKANFGIQDNQKLTSGLFERMKWMDLALQKKSLNNEPEPDGFNFEIFPLTSMLEFEEVNDQLKPFHARKSLEEKLAVIGGKSPASLVRKILKKVLDKEFGKQFSWYGRRGNCSLGSSLLGKIILECTC
ncbi:hypothetical protein OUZ56_012969 [Daphnia magna]|uniref:DUF4806 domain-containing protein n=1 Tax=Daphnia magna TaxID=35525 RepID=A0ABQ9Z4J7_9CRUS|nr:hypothetical protein OUZ56_012969 [Daphnia magna]